MHTVGKDPLLAEELLQPGFFCRADRGAVRGKELVGIITEMDFLRITSRLLERAEK